MFVFCFFKQKTADEVRISDWSSDVCSSDLICDVVPGPVSAEVAATDHATMLAEGRRLAKIAPNVAVKVPLTRDGLRTCRALADEGRMVNVTLCFSAAQAILAAKAGAAFVSPFGGRLDDVGHAGLMRIAAVVDISRQDPAFNHPGPGP